VDKSIVFDENAVKTNDFIESSLFYLPVAPRVPIAQACCAAAALLQFRNSPGYQRVA